MNEKCPKCGGFGWVECENKPKWVEICPECHKSDAQKAIDALAAERDEWKRKAEQFEAWATQKAVEHRLAADAIENALGKSSGLSELLRLGAVELDAVLNDKE